MTRPNMLGLGRSFPLGPDVKIVNPLIFAVAPSQQGLSQSSSKDRKPVLVDGTRKLYEGEDYALVRNADKEIVAITSLVGGYLDAGGNAVATHTASHFQANGASEAHDAVGEATRVTIDAAVGGPCDFEVEGSDNGIDWYSLTGSVVIPVLAGQVRTAYVDEATSQLRVSITNNTGPIQVRVQDEA